MPTNGFHDLKSRPTTALDRTWDKIYSVFHMGTQDLVEPVVYDPFDPATIADPYPIYVRLRDDAPVYYVERDDVWAVSRYDDVVRVLRDTATF